MSARRLLVLALVAALGGGAGEAVAKAPAKHRTAKRKVVKRPRARAVKLDASLAWVPLAALAGGAAPLTGAVPAAGGAPGAGATTPGAPPAPAPAAPTATAPPSSDPAPPSTQAVGVTLDDRGGYSARLSRASVTAGAVVVQLRNQGEDDHNLRVVPTDHAGAAVDFPLTGSGQNATRTLTLSAGSYRLFCTLTAPVNHELAGMNATLAVS